MAEDATKEVSLAEEAEQLEQSVTLKELKVLANIKSAVLEQSVPKVRAAVRELGALENDIYGVHQHLLKQLPLLAKLFPQSADVFDRIREKIQEQFEWIFKIVTVRGGTLISLANSPSPDFAAIGEEVRRATIYLSLVLEKIEIATNETKQMAEFTHFYRGKLRCMDCGGWVNGGTNNAKVFYRCDRCVKTQDGYPYGEYIDALRKKGWKSPIPTTYQEKQEAKAAVPTAAPRASSPQQPAVISKPYRGRLRCLNCGKLGWGKIEEGQVRYGCEECKDGRRMGYDDYVRALKTKGWTIF